VIAAASEVKVHRAGQAATAEETWAVKVTDFPIAEGLAGKCSTVTRWKGTTVSKTVVVPELLRLHWYAGGCS